MPFLLGVVLVSPRPTLLDALLSPDIVDVLGEMLDEFSHGLR